MSQEQDDKVKQAMNALIGDDNSKTQPNSEQSEAQGIPTKDFYGLPDELSRLLGGNEYFDQYIEFSQDEKAKSKIEAFADKFNNKLSKDEQKQLVSEIKSIEGNISRGNEVFGATNCRPFYILK